MSPDPSVVDAMVAERFGLPATREQWVEVRDDETPAVLTRRLHRIARGLAELARMYPEAAVDIERLRRAAWGDSPKAIARRRKSLRQVLDGDEYERAAA